MNKKYTNYFYKTYPSLFKEHKLSCSETAMCWGLQCGDGWRDLIDGLCSVLVVLEKKYNIEIIFTTVKEKFGSLRVYYTIKYNKNSFKQKEIREHINNLILFYEIMSEHTCEICGKIGKLRNEKGRFYIQTLCDKHSKGEKK